MTPTLTVDDIIEAIHQEIIGAGSLRALAREWGLAPSLISEAANRVKAPCPAILDRLGIERVTVYRRKGDAA